jgi:hypothetical protein
MSDWLGGGLLHNSYTQCARSQARSCSREGHSEFANSRVSLSENAKRELWLKFKFDIIIINFSKKPFSFHFQLQKILTCLGCLYKYEKAPPLSIIGFDLDH